MRRRDVLAGIGSLGVIGGAGAVAINGLPSTDNADNESDDENGPVDTRTVETIEAPGSEAGELRVPAADQATFIDFFATWCDPCEKQMPALIEAHDRLGDDVLFMSVTNEAVGRSVTKAKVVDWWEKNDGNWTLGIDPTAELSSQYVIQGIPYAVAIDASGRIQWTSGGEKSTDEFVAGIEQALEAGGQ
ncbi:TlpA family protein disulfide reductase [Natrinema limicola]|uniref:Alkyl hydroperoxide reductase/ thiol specific antioxidant/ Mal allergen n=1 Tax=Natrinema limicola JCM 13563 TaxID=1230457 RepID=M0CFP6_9EURY|nr:TlpA disulfide reductase family protein [Natrinema limicola]ELZ21187.1 alkyl hydroperoxide reductase/ thiol specific antioxidant/ Mal allergen [Natrinema limicola JCM 13563]